MTLKISQFIKKMNIISKTYIDLNLSYLMKLRTRKILPLMLVN